ncbi:MAG TPA: 50S ribosomal protein L15 [Fimbriimonadaceae bacterium]|nr:50S ribosomal protein L15 [Fimbriimonadaceae bacterium]HRJ32308.1 50S ribosomal protein L15 [Fimbriimonadaceae bacterium]
MSLHTLRSPKGSTKRKRRVARGIGSGMGKTATRGTKGQKARRQISPWFEGGQTPIHRRLPIKKGFRNVNHKEYAIVNLDDLQNLFEKGAEVTPEALINTGIIPGVKDGVKILAFGTLDKKLKVSAHKFSKAAAEAITKAGGEVIVL